MHNLLQSLSPYDQKAIFDGILRDLAHKFLQDGTDALRDKESLMRNTGTVSGIAAMVAGLVQSNALLEEHVVQWLTNTNGEYASLGLDARRAVIATLATSQGKSLCFLEARLLTFAREAGANTREDD